MLNMRIPIGLNKVTAIIIGALIEYPSSLRQEKNIYDVRPYVEVHTTGISDGLTEAAVHSATTFATRVRNGSDERKYN